MRSHAELLSSSPPSTACSASTECGGRRSDSTWASPGTVPARAKRSVAEGIGLLSPRWAGAALLPRAARRECVTDFPTPQYDFLWTSCAEKNKSREAHHMSFAQRPDKEKRPPGGGLLVAVCRLTARRRHAR